MHIYVHYQQTIEVLIINIKNKFCKTVTTVVCPGKPEIQTPVNGNPEGKSFKKSLINNFY